MSKLIPIILGLVIVFISIKYINLNEKHKYLQYELYLTSDDYKDFLQAGGYELDYYEYLYYISKK
jgi:hypothetical protein